DRTRPPAPRSAPANPRHRPQARSHPRPWPQHRTDRTTAPQPTELTAKETRPVGHRRACQWTAGPPLRACDAGNTPRCPLRPANRQRRTSLSALFLSELAQDAGEVGAIGRGELVEGSLDRGPAGRADGVENA